MVKNQELEYRVQEEPTSITYGEKLAHYLEEIPPILGYSTFAGLLYIAFTNASPPVSNCLATGNGFNSGMTRWREGTQMSLAALAASMIPDAIAFAEDVDLKKAGANCAIKLMEFGAGYLIGRFWSSTD